MVHTVGLRDIIRRWGEYVDYVLAGERVEVTKRGRRALVLLSASAYDRLVADAARASAEA